MENQNKYYTPEIEEFHVGFEYEYNYNDKGWTSKVYESHYNIDEIEAKDYCRVKYLDREDIESLGFKHIGRTIDDWYESKITRPAIMSTHTNRRFVLTHDFRTNQGVVIKAYDYESGDEGENTIYRGTCKNKSELKRILKMIGV